MEESTHAVVDWSLLPRDPWFEILTRTPLESLQSCRKVCAEWRCITYEPNFIARHCHQTQTISGYFIQSMKHDVYSSSFVPFSPLPTSVPPPSLDFLPKATKILSSTHRGLLCCESRYKYHIPRYYVCKPATKQFRVLPSPRTRFHTKKVAIVASASGILHFKIVRLSDPRKDVRYMICEVFDSRTWRWRRYREKIPPLILRPGPGVEIDDVVHWLVCDSNNIFAFDVVREAWRLIPLPEWNHEEELWRDNKLIMGCEGRLCVVRVMNRDGTGEDELEVWTMVDRDAGQWRRIERLVKLEPRGCVGDLYTQQVVFMTSICEVLWFELENRKVTRMPVDHHFATGFKFESDLIPCSLDARIDVLL